MPKSKSVGRQKLGQKQDSAAIAGAEPLRTREQKLTEALIAATKLRRLMVVTSEAASSMLIPKTAVAEYDAIIERLRNEKVQD